MILFLSLQWKADTPEKSLDMDRLLLPILFEPG
jgi:hypothetical protein